MIRGCGLDISASERFASLERAVLERLFSPIELEEALSITDDEALLNFYASRFAAKEALSKALGCGFKGFSPTDVTVVSDHQGAPYFLLEENVKALVGESKIHLSLSHERSYSVAMVVLDGEK